MVQPAPRPIAPSTALFQSDDKRPLRSLEDWQRLHPPRHWKAGYSAMELARCWHVAQGIPPRVAAVLASGGLGPLALRRGIAECTTPVPGQGRRSQTDLMVEALDPQGALVVLGVEGKVHESFGLRVAEWLAREEVGRSRANKEERLRGLCAGLGLAFNLGVLGGLRYELLHRTFSAVAHARAQGAQRALLVAHSFAVGGDVENKDDYAEFLRALGAQGDLFQGLVDLNPRDGISLGAAWGSDTPLSG